MRICKKIDSESLEIQEIQRLIKVAKEVDPLLMLKTCKDNIWLHKDQILKEDAEFFLNNSFDQFIINNENKQFMHNLITLIKNKYVKMKDVEKEEIWKLMKDLLRGVAEYKKATNDYA